MHSIFYTLNLIDEPSLLHCIHQVARKGMDRWKGDREGRKEGGEYSWIFIAFVPFIDIYTFIRMHLLQATPSF